MFRPTGKEEIDACLAALRATCRLCRRLMPVARPYKLRDDSMYHCKEWHKGRQVSFPATFEQMSGVEGVSLYNDSFKCFWMFFGRADFDRLDSHRNAQ